MPTRNFRQSVIALALVALLGAPLTSAAAPRNGGFRLQDSYSDVVAWRWSVINERWSKNGCSIDPFGRCVTNSLEGTDNGCLIDPSGRCVAVPQETTKEGCRIDPSGGCVPG